MIQLQKDTAGTYRQKISINRHEIFADVMRRWVGKTQHQIRMVYWIHLSQPVLP